RRRRRDVPRADLRRADCGRLPVGHAAQPHRDREPRVPGAVRDERRDDVGARERRHGRSRLQRRRGRRADGVVSHPPMEKSDVNRWLRYHSEISLTLTQQRTALESALIPVSAYILIACIECYRRYPALIEEIELAMAPEEIGTAGHHVGNEIDLVRFWGVSNFPLVGRKILSVAGMIEPDDDIA